MHSKCTQEGKWYLRRTRTFNQLIKSQLLYHELSRHQRPATVRRRPVFLSELLRKIFDMPLAKRVQLAAAGQPWPWRETRCQDLSQLGVGSLAAQQSAHVQANTTRRVAAAFPDSSISFVPSVALSLLAIQSIAHQRTVTLP